jgi:hypothetical protein
MLQALGPKFGEEAIAGHLIIGVILRRVCRPLIAIRHPRDPEVVEVFENLGVAGLHRGLL